jgi:HSP20 family protein
MNLIPWRKQEGPIALQSDFEDLWRNFSEPFFDGFRNRLPAAFQTRSLPLMNVSETEQTYVVALELPGLDVKDVNIELMGNQLHVWGERKWDDDKKEKEFHRVEWQYGTFSRTLMLPDNLRLERDAIDATFHKGILEIRIPKVEPTPSAKIPIKAK